MQTTNLKTDDPGKGKDQNPNHIDVAVITTSGSWPADGYESIPNHQKVSVFLKKATDKLGIVSTAGWVAKVDGKVIQVDNTYLENNLSGKIDIDYGPPEGGGGLK